MQLSVMLKAGVSLSNSLEILAKQSKNSQMKTVLGNVSARVRKGDSFSVALSRHLNLFDQLFVVSVEIGEESGRLPDVLENLAHSLEKLDALKRKLTQALAYPVLVLAVASGAVGFLLLFIVPTFAEMFMSFKMELPGSTLIVLALSSWVVENGTLVLVGLLVGGVLGRKVVSAGAVKNAINSVLIKLPAIGVIISTHHVARFCRTLGTLLQARVQLIDALEVTRRITTVEALKEEIGGMIRYVKGGRMLSEPLSASGFFPPMVSQMIAVGEETSELGEMLMKVANHYETEIDGKLDVLSNIIEPVMILLLGLLVGGILVAMYLPMFDMVNLAGGMG